MDLVSLWIKDRKTITCHLINNTVTFFINEDSRWTLYIPIQSDIGPLRCEDFDGVRTKGCNMNVPLRVQGKAIWSLETMTTSDITIYGQ